VASSSPAPDRTDQERWTLIWVRDLEAEQLQTRDGERTACARIEDQGSSLTLDGTVLPWLSDLRRDPLRGSRAFCAAVDDQLQDWIDVRTEDPRSLLCVAGDFNQDLGASHYYGSRIGKQHLRASLQFAGLRCCTAGDLDPVHPSTGRQSIDHLMLDERIRMTGKAVAWPDYEGVGKRLSDHYGVWTEVSLL